MEALVCRLAGLSLALAACSGADAARNEPRVVHDQAPVTTEPPAPQPPVPQPGSRPPVSQPPLAAADSFTRIPLTSGLTLVSVLHFPGGDRENVITVENVAAEGVTYAWHFRQSGGSIDGAEATFERFVREADLAAAPRLNTVFTGARREDTPGYTAFSLSRAVYARLRNGEQVPFTVTAFGEDPLGGITGGMTGGLLASRVTLKGTLAPSSGATEPMPVLLNGRRVSVPALRVRGRFAFQERKQEGDYWVLADSAHPLVLRVVNGDHVLQTIRIELPESLHAAAELVERDLERDCRAELPGIYFAFASSELASVSERAIGGVADLMARHADWSLAIEGHTDSIGDPASNRSLSLRRAEAVRAALVGRHAVGPRRLTAAGFGSTRPRESNATIEGRARNRRVELTRGCDGD